MKAIDPDADDQSKLTYIKVSDPTNGTLKSVDSSTGEVIYTPKAGFVGEDKFIFKANDGKVDGNTATVTISVKEATYLLRGNIVYDNANNNDSDGEEGNSN